MNLFLISRNKAELLQRANALATAADRIVLLDAGLALKAKVNTDDERYLFLTAGDSAGPAAISMAELVTLTEQARLIHSGF